MCGSPTPFFPGELSSDGICVGEMRDRDLLLVIDVGNSQTVTGIYRGDQLLCRRRVATHLRLTADEIEMTLRGLLSADGVGREAIADAVLASVVPPLDDPMKAAIHCLFGCEPMMVDSGNCGGLVLKVDEPSEVGADRMVNAVAAFHRFGGPLLVLDLGTATTIDAVDSDGAYLGGAIAPGMEVAAEALASRAAKLPRVPLVPPDRFIGKNTAECMRIGIFHGYVGLIEGLVARMAAELPRRPTLVATGGLASRVAAALGCDLEVDPDLSLLGMRLVYERTKAGP